MQARRRFGSLYEPILHCVNDPARYTFNADAIRVEAPTGARRRLIDYRKPTPLHTLQVFRGGEADVLLISSEAVHQSAAPLAEFTAPARFVSTAEHRTSNDRAVLVKLLQPHVRELLKDHLRALRTEFPAFYGPATPAKGPGFWAQLRSLLQLHLRHAASAR